MDGRGEVLQSATLRINRPRHAPSPEPVSTGAASDDVVSPAAPTVDVTEFARTAFLFWHQTVTPVLEMLSKCRGTLVTPWGPFSVSYFTSSAMLHCACGCFCMVAGAGVQARLVITRLGSAAPAEIEGWRQCLRKVSAQIASDQSEASAPNPQAFSVLDAFFAQSQPSETVDLSDIPPSSSLEQTRDQTKLSADSDVMVHVCLSLLLVLHEV
jgi:hypothetical protein